MRALFDGGRFAEVQLTASLEVLRARDTKGLYQQEAKGAALGLTGVSTPYEAPEHAELVIDTRVMSVDAAVGAVLGLVRSMAPRQVVQARPDPDNTVRND